MKKIKLGDKVKCIHTGFIGIVVSKTEFINGCIQYGVLPKMKKGGEKYPEEMNIDEGGLKIITPKKKEKDESDPGGRTRPGIKMRGF